MDYDGAVSFVRQAASMTSDDSTALITGTHGVVNHAYYDFVERTGCNIGQFTGRALTTSDDEYDLATLTGKSDIIRLRRVFLRGGATTRRLLTPIDSETMALRREVDAGTGEPRCYNVDGRNHFVLDILPGSGLTLDGDYVQRPAALTTGGAFTTGNVPIEFSDAIAFRAVELLMRYENRLDDADSWLRRYEERVGRYLQSGGRMMGPRLPAMRPSRVERPVQAGGGAADWTWWE